MIKMEEIRKKLIEEIKQAGISQTELAKKIGVGQPTISYYMKGKKMPSMETFANLCEVLDLDANEILCIRRNTDNII